jgi:hypothetical protein
MNKYYKSMPAAIKMCDSYVIPRVVIQYRVSQRYEVVSPGYAAHMDAVVIYCNAAAQAA